MRNAIWISLVFFLLALSARADLVLSGTAPSDMLIRVVVSYDATNQAGLCWVSGPRGSYPQSVDFIRELKIQSGGQFKVSFPTKRTLLFDPFDLCKTRFGMFELQISYKDYQGDGDPHWVDYTLQYGPIEQRMLSDLHHIYCSLDNHVCTYNDPTNPFDIRVSFNIPGFNPDVSYDGEFQLDFSWTQGAM
jgi:hypothetical protein